METAGGCFWRGAAPRPAAITRVIALQFCCAPVAQLDRARVFGTRGYRFESCRARHLGLPVRSACVVLALVTSIYTEVLLANLHPQVECPVVSVRYAATSCLRHFCRIWHFECFYRSVPINLLRYGFKYPVSNLRSHGNAVQRKSTKRQYIRYPVEMPVELRLKPTDANATFGRALDLCEQGLGLLAACDLAVGQHVELEFTIPEIAQRFKFPAEVRNRNGYRYGFEFDALSGVDPSDFAEMLTILG